MNITRCAPLSIRISRWRPEAHDFDHDDLDLAFAELEIYRINSHTGERTPAHFQVTEPHRGTYRVNADGTYIKLSDELLTLEQLFEQRKKINDYNFGVNI